MLIHIPNLFSKDEVAYIVKQFKRANWQAGKNTAGHAAIQVKNNRQLHENDPFAIELGDEIIKRLAQHPTFFSAALPHKIFPPMFNCYAEGETYGFHVDNAIRTPINGGVALRADVSSTLFFSEPDEYIGGELTILDTYGQQQVKFPAGDLVVYPSTSLHQVSPIQQGTRYAAFLWTQSLVRSDENRRLLFELDKSIQQLTQDIPQHPSLLSLTNHYHNLLRQWAEL